MNGTFVAVIAAVALTGTACHRGHGPHDLSPERAKAFIHDRVEDALEDLEASPAQRAQVAALEQKLVAQGLLLKEQSQRARQELFAQLQSAVPDRARLHAMVDERVEAYRHFAHQLADAALDVHATLTPEQRGKVDKKLSRFERH